MKGILNKIKIYLTDWKNLLTHSIVGIGILLGGIFLPIHPHARMTVVGSVVFINVLRMKYI
ncbi:MAG: hypothetical protein APG12_01036 [Candidatus Methanofastidiosum methylothiophilum]|uniref:Uncharacterized protein n=1 Tax=Candidatus Methanofastidiosum methylothiophilum TaxID=1705564 RepID=A0A150IKR5_9EURY|nr:MAG: hypothetical protein APG10_00794 [Candidatus Methanofastidiosum methylthiophilus]KYC47665.1 MAG: hypothetical protein APG11_00986 [Candidatus Methanofastidiosum methylthiophilus]KYC50126.1 MAG: hypothetical protein APG12_01036 [Candidatus Methanofastidiosum methylthiophilus]